MDPSDSLTCGATPADRLTASIATEPFWSTYFWNSKVVWAIEPWGLNLLTSLLWRVDIPKFWTGAILSWKWTSSLVMVRMLTQSSVEFRFISPLVPTLSELEWHKFTCFTKKPSNFGIMWNWISFGLLKMKKLVRGGGACVPGAPPPPLLGSANANDLVTRVLFQNTKLQWCLVYSIVSQLFCASSETLLWVHRGLSNANYCRNFGKL